MKKLITIKCFQHKTRLIGKVQEPLRLYVIYRENEEKHLAFNNTNWLPEFTNDDNLNVNYFETTSDERFEMIKSRTF